MIIVIHIHLLKELQQFQKRKLQGRQYTNKKVIFKNRAPFTDCITEINNTQIDESQKIDVLISMHNLI